MKDYKVSNKKIEFENMDFDELLKKHTDLIKLKKYAFVALKTCPIIIFITLILFGIPLPPLLL